MNENKENQEIRTPITVMMDMARNEIGNLVFSCMSKNNIPPGLMSYILKDILSDVMQVEIEQLAERGMVDFHGCRSAFFGFPLPSYPLFCFLSIDLRRKSPERPAHISPPYHPFPFQCSASLQAPLFRPFQPF